MTEIDKTYLDHAATSWPKSEAVIEAMSNAMRRVGAAGRGAHQSAVQANSQVQTVRCELAQLIGVHSPNSISPNSIPPNSISVHSSGTAALNAAIHGLVRPGDHVVTTAADHNSVLRPLTHLQQTANVRLSIVPCDTKGLVAAEDVLAQVQTDTRLVVVTHASNVTGALQPVEEIGSALSSHDAIFLIDAAQTLGYLPIDVHAIGADALAAPGHKGTAGPLGTGCLYLAPPLHSVIQPTIQGGTGSRSESLEMPIDFPGKLEAGNLNVPALAGWAAALSELRQRGIEAVTGRLQSHSARLHESLGRIDGVRLFSEAGRLAIASLRVPGLSPTDVAAILDSEFAIETRAGLHCAALIHQHLGSDPEGTLRISAGFNTTDEQIDAACAALKSVIDSCQTT